MRRLLGWLMLLSAAVAAALVLSRSWGNVTLWLPPYRVDMSLQSAVVFLVAVVLALMLVIWLISGIFGIPDRVRQYRKKRLEERRLRTLADLVIEFLEGRFARAFKTAKALREQPLLDGAPQTLTAAMAMGASAAHQLRDTELRDQWVADLQAFEAGRRDADPVIAPLLKAEFALDERKGAQALSALAPLTRGDKRQIHILRLSLRANQQQGNWQEVLRVSRLLEHHKAIRPIEAARHAQQVAKAWISEGQHHAARQLIEASLDAQWDSGLCMLYGQCEDNTKEQLGKLERWLVEHPQDAELHWALGRLCQRQQLWGKARMHLDTSLRYKPSAQTHRALAEIAEVLEQKETAAIHWKAAAQLA
jgi:HemY protein